MNNLVVQSLLNNKLSNDDHKYLSSLHIYPFKTSISTWLLLVFPLLSVVVFCLLLLGHSVALIVILWFFSFVSSLVLLLLCFFSYASSLLFLLLCLFSYGSSLVLLLLWFFFSCASSLGKLILVWMTEIAGNIFTYHVIKLLSTFLLDNVTDFIWFSLVMFHRISTPVSYLIPNPIHIYIYCGRKICCYDKFETWRSSFVCT